jgi:hypothetical protein
VFTFVTKSLARRSSSVSKRACLRLEALETRYCLSTHQTLSLAPLTGQLGAASSQGPVITNFQATHDSGNFWTFTGQVTDTGGVAGLIVTFGGLVSLQGKTAAVNADGSFSLTIALQPRECGTATAQTTDYAGLTSNVATADVTVAGWNAT